MDKEIKIDLKCTFCGSGFPVKEPEPNDGDQIICTNCGRSNDFSAIKQVAVNKGLDIAKKQAKKYVEDEVKKMFKDWK